MSGSGHGIGERTKLAYMHLYYIRVCTGYLKLISCTPSAHKYPCLHGLVWSLLSRNTRPCQLTHHHRNALPSSFSFSATSLACAASSAEVMFDCLEELSRSARATLFLRSSTKFASFVSLAQGSQTQHQSQSPSRILLRLPFNANMSSPGSSATRAFADSCVFSLERSIWIRSSEALSLLHPSSSSATTCFS